MIHFQQARRQFLYQSFTGVGGAALLHMLNRDLIAAPGLEPIHSRRRSLITRPRQSRASFSRCLAGSARWIRSIPSRRWPNSTTP